MKPIACLSIFILLTGCLAPRDSGVNSKAWEVPVSAVLLPIDALICATHKIDEAKANQGDADAALGLARSNLDWGNGRSYFEHQAQVWYAKANELEHPKAQRVYAQWRREYTPPPVQFGNDIFNPLIPLIPLLFD